METLLKPLTDEHLSACIALWQASWPATSQATPTPHAEDFAKMTNGEEIYITVTDNLLSGFISFQRPDSFIHFLMVDTAFQRQGIGRKLLAFATQTLQGPLELKCELHNVAAQRFYLAQNFVEVERVLTGDNAYILFRQTA